MRSNRTKFIIAFSVGILFCSVARAQNEPEILLDSFEGTLDGKTVDFGAGAGSTLTAGKATEQKACGNQSIKIDYELNPGGYLYCARGHGLDVAGALWEGPEPAKIEWDDYGSISFQMFGSGEGNVAFDIKDNSGEVFRAMVDGNFSGWKEIKIPFTEFKVRDDWQPASADGNRTLDFPVRSYQWEPKTPGQGTLFFDCVKLIK